MRYLACVVLFLALCGSASAQRPIYRNAYPVYRPVYPAVVYPVGQPVYPYMPPVRYPVYPQPAPSWGYQSSYWWQW